jgi:hypothetical protein
MENETNVLIFSIVSAVISLLGAFVTIYKIKPEHAKLEAEGRKLDSDSLSSIANAAESIATGAKVSTDQLLKRIEEMEVREVKREEDLNKLKSEEAITRAKLVTLQVDAANTRAELDSVKAELIEWKDYAFRLAHQVKSLGYEPVPFKLPILHNSLIKDEL